MGYVYCEHLDDADESDSELLTGNFITLVKTESLDEEITKENYANSGSGDIVDKYLDLVGKDKAIAYNCPICQELGREPTVYFLHDNSIEAPNGQSFVRLRKKNGVFVHDLVDQPLERDSMRMASANV